MAHCSNTPSKQALFANESEFQRETGLFVQREVICSISMLVHQLTEWNPEKLYEEFPNLFYREDEYGDPVEIFEYWIVSCFLAEKLQEKGEIIEQDFFGHAVWGRTTTGQAILMDHVIREIFLDLRK